MRLALPLLLLGVLSACTVDLISPSNRACDETHPCQSGQWCRVDTCTSTPPEEWDNDGGTDAGSKSDGGTSDGGQGADGGQTADAGTDGGSNPGEDAGVVVTVVPDTWAMLSSSTKHFSASVRGTSNTAVTWDYTPKAAGGGIDAEGLFTSPQEPGAYQVTATSVADTSRSASATVTVYDGPPTTGLIAHYSAERLMGDGQSLPADGGTVSEWKDLSGNGHHLTQANATYQPVFKVNAIKGLPTVVFDGRDDRLASAVFSQVYDQPNTVVLVFRAVDRVVTFFDSNVSTARHRLKMSSNTSSWSVQMYAGGFAQPAQRTLTVGAMVRSLHIFNGTSSRQRFDGMEPSATSYTNLGNHGLGGIQLGLRQDNVPDDVDASKTGPAEIAEVLVYEHALDDTEINLVEAYLTKRYAP